MQQTIKAPLPPHGYSYFCVLDLSQHPDFRDFPYVKGPPNFRFYAGTPLMSPEGSPIGSLFVIDDRARHNVLDKSDINFLGIMARNVMEYLNMQRESMERKRISIMSKGLAAFTEGRQYVSRRTYFPIMNSSDCVTFEVECSTCTDCDI